MSEHSPLSSKYSLQIILSPTFDKIADKIDVGCVVHTGMRNTDITIMGHDVMTFGYATNNLRNNYLLIFDGWVEYGRCILYDNIPKVNALSVWAIP